MTESISSRIVGCGTSLQVWQIFETYFASQTKAKINQFKTQLQNTKKQSPSINEYLLKIKALVDQLRSVGHVLTAKDHIDVIFKSLPPEYSTFIMSVSSWIEPYTVWEIESLQMA